MSGRADAHSTLARDCEYNTDLNIANSNRPYFNGFQPVAGRSNEGFYWPTATGTLCSFPHLLSAPGRIEDEAELIGSTGPEPRLAHICPDCPGITFKRAIDRKRHYEAFHTKAVLWCPAYDCPRNSFYGDYPFPRVRKDKLKEHIRKMHKSDNERQRWPEWFAQLRTVTRNAEKRLRTTRAHV
jgi:hypothetical protein